MNVTFAFAAATTLIEAAGSKGEAPNLPVDRLPNTHLSSGALTTDQKNESSPREESLLLHAGENPAGRPTSHWVVHLIHLRRSEGLQGGAREGH